MADHSRDRVEAAMAVNGFPMFANARSEREVQIRAALAAADAFDVANGVVRLADDAASIERYCEMLHDAYESAAEHWGWATNPESRKPWADVPERNKMTMRMALGNLLAALGAAGVGEQQGGQT